MVENAAASPGAAGEPRAAAVVGTSPARSRSIARDSRWVDQLQRMRPIGWHPSRQALKERLCSQLLRFLLGLRWRGRAHIGGGSSCTGGWLCLDVARAERGGEREGERGGKRRAWTARSRSLSLDVQEAVQEATGASSSTWRAAAAAQDEDAEEKQLRAQAVARWRLLGL